MCELCHAGKQRPPAFFTGIEQNAAIDLYAVDREGTQIGKGGTARTDIVQRNAISQGTEPPDCFQRSIPVTGERIFGDLHQKTAVREIVLSGDLADTHQSVLIRN